MDAIFSQFGKKCDSKKIKFGSHSRPTYDKLKAVTFSIETIGNVTYGARLSQPLGHDVQFNAN